MAFMTNAEWALYKSIIDEYMADDSAKEIITWKKHQNVLDRYGENKTVPYQDIQMEALVQYNFFRSWPINDATVSGKIDKESVMLYLNTQYLIDQGWTNSEDMLNFDPGKDYFIVDGLVYKCFGETRAAQAKDSALVQLIILKREEIATSDIKYD